MKQRELVRCAYCGGKGAKVRRRGEPRTCAYCADLPHREPYNDHELEELERQRVELVDELDDEPPLDVDGA